MESFETDVKDDPEKTVTGSGEAESEEDGKIVYFPDRQIAKKTLSFHFSDTSSASNSF